MPTSTDELVRVAPNQLPRYLAPLVARGPRRARSRTFHVIESVVYPKGCVTLFVRDAYLGRYEITLRSPKVVETSVSETPPSSVDAYSRFILEHGTWEVDLGRPVIIRVTHHSVTITDFLCLRVNDIEVSYLKTHPAY